MTESQKQVTRIADEFRVFEVNHWIGSKPLDMGVGPIENSLLTTSSVVLCASLVCLETYKSRDKHFFLSIQRDGIVHLFRISPTMSKTVRSLP